MSGPEFILGLDLGAMGDFSAAALVERPESAPPLLPDQHGPPRLDAYQVRSLHRWKLGTPYPQIVREVCGWLERPELQGASLVVDQTGVGKPICDLFREANVRQMYPVVITAGHATTRGVDRSWHVPKRVLVSVMQSLLGHRRLHIASSLPDAAVLKKELETFKVKVTVAGNEQFSAWRERDRDDTVLALALACWAGERARPFRRAKVG